MIFILVSTFTQYDLDLHVHIAIQSPKAKTYLTHDFFYSGLTKPLTTATCDNNISILPRPSYTSILCV